MRGRIIQIENALAETLRFRSGGLCEITRNKGGDHVARIYDATRQSALGGWEIVVELNLADMAADIERAFS